MQYVGGKQKSGGAQIAVLVNRVIKRRGLTTYSEPFCGGLSITSRIVCAERHASDACTSLITMYRALQSGTWTPPHELTREQWDELRAADDNANPMTAFAGFGCSNRGAWFASYVDRFKRTGQNYVSAATAAAESLANKMRKCGDVQFSACDYRAAMLGEVVYCDPPYAGTLGYPAVGSEWDPDAFWRWVAYVGESRLIAVSERQAPDGFEPVLAISVQHRIATGSGKRRDESLFVPSSQVDAWRERAC